MSSISRRRRSRPRGKRTRSSPPPGRAIEHGAWIDVNAATVPLADYATRWLRERALLRPRTSELYEGLLRLHILPTLGPVTLADLKPPMIRTWHAGLLSGPRPGATTAAKSYRLLRTILATAVDDDVLEKNPCRIRGAGVEHSKERPIATIEQVYALADAIDPMYRVLVLTATFTSLRLGELRALTRKHLNLLHATVHVAGQLQELKDGSLVLAPPKTAAGVRTVSIPAALIPELEEQLAYWAGPGLDGFVFPGTKEQPFRRGSLYTAWRRGDEGRRRRRAALPRPPSHRSDARGHHRRDHEGAHGAHGPRVAARRAHLPARDARARPGDRPSIERRHRASGATKFGSCHRASRESELTVTVVGPHLLVTLLQGEARRFWRGEMIAR